MQYVFPLNEVATDFYDELKSRSSGYASFDYEDAGYRKSDVGKGDTGVVWVRGIHEECRYGVTGGV